MKITVKVLQGQECNVEVSSGDSIHRVKEKIEEILHVPVIEQKIIFLGKTLADEKYISDYPAIRDGAKLHVMAKKREDLGGNLNIQLSSSKQETLQAILVRFLKKHYSDRDAEKIAVEFMKNVHNSVSKLSLDDLERAAITYLAEKK